MANGDVEGVGLALDGLGARGSGRPGGPRITGRSVKLLRWAEGQHNTG